MNATPVPPGAGFELSATALRALVEEAPDAIFVADLHGRYTYVNKAALRLLGYTREEILAKTINDVIPPEDGARLAGMRAKMLQGATDSGEWRLKRADGSWVSVEVTANILANGHWHGFVRDVTARQVAQAEREALAARVQRDRHELQALFETLPVAVVLFGGDGAHRWNHCAEELLGDRLKARLDVRRTTGTANASRQTPLGEEDLVLEKAMQGETVNAQELQIRRADGSLTPVLASSAPVRDESGQLAGAVCVFVDLSERMRLEQHVRQSERLLKAVFDLLPVGVRIADPSGVITTANPAAERIWGGVCDIAQPRAGEHRGWWIANGKPVAPGEWPLALALLRREPCTVDLIRIQSFDGSSKTIINSAAPIVDEDGDVAGAVVVDEDITALYDAQQKQVASEQLFRTVFDLLPVGVWICDREGKILSANPAGQQIWQGTRYVKPEDFGEYRAWWVESGEPVADQEWGVARAVRDGETSRRQLIRIQCFDDSFKTVINWAAPIRSDTGEITGAVAVNEDVTALHQTQEQLRAAVRDREQILAVVSHDLRNPLNAIVATAATIDLKASALPGGGSIQGLVAMLKEAARQMSGMVNDLLTVAINGTGRSLLHVTPTRPSSLVERAARAARPLFARAGVSFQVQVEPGLPTLPVDSDRISRVFANLLENARKFTAHSGTVVFRAQAQGAGVRFCITNTGPPLSPGEIDAMFSPFWQAGSGDRRGAGLGLSICRSIVEAHGGTIWAEPSAGQRVRVCLLLPSAALIESGPQHPPSSA
jgi:PAS domain S-box-containing protein